MRKICTYAESKNDAEKKHKMPIKDILTATNGKTVKSSVVFIAAFKYLQKEAKEYLGRNRLMKKSFKTCTDSDIQWIITVPAIWNDAAKLQMRQWVIDAGLVDPDIHDQCKIVYEPDCASLAIQYEINQSKSQICNITDDPGDDDQKGSAVSPNDELKFTKGEKYILVDAGGGTTDIACHQILGADGQYGVKEILHPSGGPWGSCYIDDQFVKLLKEIFGVDWIDEFKNSKPNLYLQLLDNFQNAKSSFYTDLHEHAHNVRLSMEFVAFIQDKLEEKEDDEGDENCTDVEDVVAAASVFGQSKLVCIASGFIFCPSITV